jgi:hypothetical protein
MSEGNRINSANALDDQCETLIAEHPELFGSDPDSGQPDHPRQNREDSAALRKELNELVMQLCSLPGDHSFLIHKLSQAIRKLDAKLDFPLIRMRNEVLFREKYEGNFKIKGRRVQLDSILAMQTEYSDCQPERLRKVYRLLHVIFSQAGSRRGVDLSGHLGWMFLNLSRDAFQAMDRGHATGRVWDASEMDASARIYAQEQKLSSDLSSSTTLIWNVNGANSFEPEPHFLKDLSPARVQAELDQIIAGIQEFVSKNRARYVSSLNHHLT